MPRNAPGRRDERDSRCLEHSLEGSQGQQERHPRGEDPCPVRWLRDFGGELTFRMGAIGDPAVARLDIRKGFNAWHARLRRSVRVMSGVRARWCASTGARRSNRRVDERASRKSSVSAYAASVRLRPWRRDRLLAGRSPRGASPATREGLIRAPHVRSSKHWDRPR